MFLYMYKSSLLEGLELLGKKVPKVTEPVKAQPTKAKRKKSGCNCGKKLAK